MLPITEVPETIKNGFAGYRNVFCRDEGFDWTIRMTKIFDRARQKINEDAMISELELVQTHARESLNDQ